MMIEDIGRHARLEFHIRIIHANHRIVGNDVLHRDG